MSENRTAKYQRGKAGPVKNVKDKKLRANLERLDNKFKDAAESAASTEYLLMEDGGFMEAEGEMEKTFKVTQKQVKESVDVATQKKAFSLDLRQFGPYRVDYSLTGNHLLLGGAKGHLAAFNWKESELNAEINVNETVHAVKWLQNDCQYFAAAQKKYTFIYDHQGVEVHRLKNHIEATHLEYLPYHYLLASAGNTGFIKYQDVSTGQLVAELRTKLGPTTAFAQNPYNAVLHAGHSNGHVTLWAPNMSTPLVKVLSSRGPVRDVAINRDGRYMAVAGADKSLKIWDVRTFRELESYYSPTPASSVDISDTGLVAVGWGPHVQIWKDILTHGGPKQSTPYMNHLVPGSQVVSTRFCPYEDVLGLGHAQGFSSLVVPGAGEANFDSLEVNPYMNATKKGRRENEVRSLLNKLQPDMIALDPNMIGNVDQRAGPARKTAAEVYQEKEDEIANRHKDKDVDKIRPTVKGKNSALRKHLRKKTSNVIDQRKLRLEANLKREKELRENKRRERQGLPSKKLKHGPALGRFS